MIVLGFGRTLDYAEPYCVIGAILYAAEAVFAIVAKGRLVVFYSYVLGGALPDALRAVKAVVCSLLIPYAEYVFEAEPGNPAEALLPARKFYFS